MENQKTEKAEHFFFLLPLLFPPAVRFEFSADCVYTGQSPDVLRRGIKSKPLWGIRCLGWWEPAGCGMGGALRQGVGCMLARYLRCSCDWQGFVDCRSKMPQELAGQHVSKVLTTGLSMQLRWSVGGVVGLVVLCVVPVV